LPTSWHCFKDLEDQRERFERQHLDAQQQRDVTMRAGLEARENLDRALATPTPETGGSTAGEHASRRRRCGWSSSEPRLVSTGRTCRP
jgi:hypothetical protein